MAGTTILLILLAALVAAAILGAALARIWRARESTAPLVVVLFCIFSGIAVTLAAWPPKTGVDLRGGTILIYQVKGDVPPIEPRAEQEEPAPASQTKEPGMQKLIAAVARRINPGGVKEVTVRSLGPSQIEIVVPETDAHEVDRLTRILSRVGSLEFRILANQRDHKPLIERALADNKPELQSEQGRLEAWWAPVAEGQDAGLRKFPEIAMRTVARGGRQVTEVLVIKDDYNTTGSHLVQAIVVANPAGQEFVRYHLDPTGGQLLGNLTGAKLPEEVGTFTRKLGILIDGQLISASPLKGAIFQDGEFTGNFKQQQLKDLADVLSAGPLPKMLSEKPVRQLAAGPALGSDTIRHGAIALGIALVLVLALLLVCYRFAGLVACGAILLDLLLILAMLIFIKMVLTLPSLAGLLLAFAVTVGAHVLIFERIREDLDRETALRTAIRNGFSKAQAAILDVGAALLIMTSILFFTGTSEIKGFAVTVWLGTVMGWLTAVYCSRVVFDIAERRRWITRLTMLRLPIRSEINFLKIRTVAGVVSAAAVVLSLVGVSLRGPNLLGTDLTGGISVELQFQQPQTVAEVRRDLPATADSSVVEVQLAGEALGRHFLITTPIPAGRSEADYLTEVQAAIQKAFAGKLAGVGKPAAEKTGLPVSSNAIGGRLPDPARDQTVYALLVSLLCIVGYVSVRSQRANFGLATMVALLHDVIITLGLLALSQYVAPYVGFLGIEPFQIGLSVVAALLTIVGLSLAGTIVVLDRIREVRGKVQLLTEERVNASLNQILGRTLITSLAMLLLSISLYVAGGPGIHGFAFTLLVGVVVTTYSPIFVAAPFLLWMSRPAVNVAPPAQPAATGQRASKGKTRP